MTTIGVTCLMLSIPLAGIIGYMNGRKTEQDKYWWEVK